MDLFAKEANLQIVRLTERDVNLGSDLLRVFVSTMASHEVMYPNISKWVREKVLPGIQNFSRIAYLGFYNEMPVVTAVAKKGISTKFCHLHIDKSIQDQNIGELFFSLMVIDARHLAQAIHFTLPESLWDREKHFFSSFGFDAVSKAQRQYRTFDEELQCKSTYDNVWQATMTKLPKLIDLHYIDEQNVSNGLLMSVLPKYNLKIFNGDKVIEVRKKFNHKWVNRRVTLYSTHPSKTIMGYAMIKSVNFESPENLWQKYGDQLGCTLSEFNAYTAGCSKVYAIHLCNVTPYKSPIPLSQLSFLLNANLNPPQSYTTLRENKEWLKAISIADILQGKFLTIQNI